MYIDEAVWRAEHLSMPAKREALCMCFGTDLWAAEEKETRLGVGGGYGQFGILNEEEFNALIKLDGKRVQRFTENPLQFQKKFNASRDHGKKDKGSVVEIAKRRFDFQIDVEKDKHRKLMDNSGLDMTQEVQQ